MNRVSDRKRSTTLAWLQLLRIPNVFTAIADVSMGYLVADGGARRPGLWLALAAVSSCMYLSGMVLNDVFDSELDRRERPSRPIPSGRIRRQSAIVAGATLLAAGVMAAWTIGYLSESAAPWRFTVGPVAVALGVCILCYDGLFKQTVFGPLFMGGCRFFNVLLGVGMTQEAALFNTSVPWLVAGSIGLYVMGITWFARHEASQSPRPALFAGLLLMLLGIAALTLLPLRGGLPANRQVVEFTNQWVWPLVVWILTAPVWRRAIVALYSPQPAAIQATIKQALLSLIVIDALIVLLVAGPIYAMGIIALMLPTALLGRFIDMT